MSRLTRDGTAEPVSRDQILRHARGQGNVHFPCSADHEQDWQPYPVDPYSAICDDHTYCRGVLSCAVMAPPALHLRENTRSRRQGRRYDPLGRTRVSIQRGPTPAALLDAELPLVVFAPRLYVKQRHSLAKPTQHLYSNDILENTLFKISTKGSLVLKLLCTGGHFLS